METKTIIKANIRSHRGQFIGIIVMMTIAMASIIGFSNIYYSINNSVIEANNRIGTFDQSLIIGDNDITDEMLKAIETSDSISDYRITNVVGLHTIYNVAQNDESHTYHSQTFLMVDDGRYQKYDDNMTHLVDGPINPAKGEIYFASGIAQNMGLSVGDKIKIQCESSYKEFTFAGFIEEPWSSTLIGWKHIIVCQEDFDEFYNEVHTTYDGMGFENEYSLTLVELNKADSSINDADFNKIINADTGLFEVAQASLTKYQNVYYCGMLFTIISAVLIAVAIILFIVLLVIICNNISSSIKIDYKTIGIYKSQGFSSSLLRKIYLCQYLSSEIIGMALGFILSFLLSSVLLRLFSPMIGLIMKTHLNPLICTIPVVTILVISVIVIKIFTGRISKVSPQKAISEGQDDITFKSRIQAPICKRLLSASIALRNITSNIPQYIGIAVTSMILTLLLVAVFAGSYSMSQKNTTKHISIAGELSIPMFNQIPEEELQAIEDIIESHIPIKERIDFTNFYVNCNDYKTLCVLYDSADSISSVYKGRAPLYDNEIAIGITLQHSTGKTIGDTMTVTYNGNSYEYLIVGFINSLSDAGNCITLTREAGEHIDVSDRLQYMARIYVLDNPDANEWYPREDAQKIVDEIKASYDVNISTENLDIANSELGMILNISFTAIGLISVIFVIIIVFISCLKCFSNETTLLGIYKGLGFTSQMLRLQFAFRYSIICLIGGIAGIFLSFFTVERIFSVAFSSAGVAKFPIVFSLSNYLIPLAIVCAAAFIFSYLASRKVKSIDVSVLICE